MSPSSCHWSHTILGSPGIAVGVGAGAGFGDKMLVVVAVVAVVVEMHVAEFEEETETLVAEVGLGPEEKTLAVVVADAEILELVDQETETVVGLVDRETETVVELEETLVVREKAVHHMGQ